MSSARPSSRPSEANRAFARPPIAPLGAPPVFTTAPMITIPKQPAPMITIPKQPPAEIVRAPAVIANPYGALRAPANPYGALQPTFARLPPPAPSLAKPAPPQKIEVGLAPPAPLKVEVSVRVDASSQLIQAAGQAKAATVQLKAIAKAPDTGPGGLGETHTGQGR